MRREGKEREGGRRERNGEGKGRKGREARRPYQSPVGSKVISP